jgi:Spy/CpxP family protein refolding chaperone
MLTTRIGAALFLLTLLPATVLGQHHHGSETQSSQQPMMGMGGAAMGGNMPGCEMMAAGMMTGPSPATILGQSELLRLSPAQVTQLEALQRQGMSNSEARMTEMHEIHAQMNEVLNADRMDMDRYEALLRRMADQQVAMHTQSARLGQATLEILSTDQQSRLQSERQMDHSMMDSGGMEMEHQ